MVQNFCIVNRPKNWKLLTEAGGWHLSLKDVHNSSVAWRKEYLDQKRRENLSNWEEQRLNICKWLESKKQHVENIKVCYLILLKTFI